MAAGEDRLERFRQKARRISGGRTPRRVAEGSGTTSRSPPPIQELEAILADIANGTSADIDCAR